MRDHVDALDGLRGLAAVVVVIRHTLNAIAMPEDARRALLQSPVAVFLNAEGAVQLFFVLSGYVLAGSLARGGRPSDVGQYVVRRVFRIHPPYVAALLLAWAASFLYATTPGGEAVTQWQRHLTAVHISFGRLAAALGFPGDADLQLPVGWTLTVEMIFSLLLPLLVLAARVLRGVPLVAVALVALAVDGVPRWPDHTLDFSLGVLLYRERAVLARLLGGLRGVAAAAAAVAALAIHSAPLLLGWLMPWGGLLLVQHGERPIAVMSVGAGALVAVALAVPGPRALLARPALKVVGRASYSLYLVHLPVLQLLLWLWSPAAPLSLVQGMGLVGAVLATSLALASVGWRWIERPAIVAGNHVCRWLSRRVDTEALPSALASG